MLINQIKPKVNVRISLFFFFHDDVNKNCFVHIHPPINPLLNRIKVPRSCKGSDYASWKAQLLIKEGMRSNINFNGETVPFKRLRGSNEITDVSVLTLFVLRCSFIEGFPRFRLRYYL